MREKVENLLKGNVSEESNVKELVDKILNLHSSSIGETKKELENSKETINTLTAENEKLKASVKERDDQLEELKNSNVDVESLKAQIETLQADNKAKDEAHTNEMNELKKDFAIEKALNDAKAKNTKAAKALLDLEKVEIADDGTIKGLNEQIDSLKSTEDTKFLFNEEKKQTFTPVGAVPGEAGDGIPNGNVDLSKMSYDERSAYLEEHPEIEV